MISQRDMHSFLLFLFYSQAAFNTLFWSFIKTFIMMIGEIDYGSIIIEAKDQYNEETGAPLAPIPEFSAAIVCLFCLMISVLLMNLLVSVRYKSLYHGIKNTANHNTKLYIRRYYT